MQAGGGEVHVAGDDVAGLDEDFGDEVFGAASLVGGDDVLVSIVGLDGVLHAVEAAAAGVGFVAEHHGGPLAVAHGGGAGVGEQVDVNVFRSQEKGVVAGGLEGVLAFFGGGDFYRLDHFDLEGLGPGLLLLGHLLGSNPPRGDSVPAAAAGMGGQDLGRAMPRNEENRPVRRQ